MASPCGLISFITGTPGRPDSCNSVVDDVAPIAERLPEHDPEFRMFFVDLAPRIHNQGPAADDVAAPLLQDILDPSTFGAKCGRFLLPVLSEGLFRLLLQVTHEDQEHRIVGPQSDRVLRQLAPTHAGTLIDNPVHRPQGRHRANQIAWFEDHRRQEQRLLPVMDHTPDLARVSP